ncbi:MAG: hypothetical protein MHM6MM_002435 [Cercozoa sp. M6MM]
MMNPFERLHANAFGHRRDIHTRERTKGESKYLSDIESDFDLLSDLRCVDEGEDATYFDEKEKELEVLWERQRQNRPSTLRRRLAARASESQRQLLRLASRESLSDEASKKNSPRSGSKYYPLGQSQSHHSSVTSELTEPLDAQMQESETSSVSLQMETGEHQLDFNTESDEVGLQPFDLMETLEQPPVRLSSVLSAADRTPVDALES